MYWCAGHSVVPLVAERETCPKKQAGLLCSHQARAGGLPHVVLGVDYSILLTLQSVCSFVEMCVFEDGVNGQEDRDVSSLKPMA